MYQFPEFIIKAIEGKNTSLGNNGIFNNNTVSLTYSLLENRNKQVIDAIIDKLGYVPTIDEAKTKLSKLISKVSEMERPIRDQLEKLCEATVNKTLGVPQETILLNCELVDEIKPYNSLRIKPEEDEYIPNSQDININKEILKRRTIDSMVQGISYLLMTATYDNEQIDDWSKGLTKLYGDIIAVNDFLLFSEEEDITDENPMLGAYVETDLGKSDDKTVINSQGLVYPLLLQETYRGFFEMLGTHGLPNNVKDAMYIIRRADFTFAEAWDLRIGVPLWQEIDRELDNNIEPTIYPYLFSTIAELDCNEFNKLLNEVLNKNNKANEFFNEIIRDIKHDDEYQLFKKDIEKFNLEKCLITDGDDEDDKIIN
jgi:hypothetical protein